MLGSIEKKIRNNISKYGTIFFLLIDAEEISKEKASNIASHANNERISAILVGGSTIVNQIELECIINAIKDVTSLPIILFPNNITGISSNADAILFSSLLNSDDPYFIIQAQALGAPLVKKYQLEALPMGYIIVGEGGTTGFIGKARGIPLNKPNIAAMYALAAQYLGMRFIYLEAGSGIRKPIEPNIVKIVRNSFNGILIVGGGIRSSNVAKELADAGADVLVIGNLLEEDNYSDRLTNIIKATRKEI